MLPFLYHTTDKSIRPHRSFMFRCSTALIISAILISFTPPTALALCLKGDCKDGHGEIEYPDGSRYKGQFLSGNRHGQGTYLYPDGATYIGTFQADVKKGNGIMTFPDGAIYNGTFAKGLPNGFGTLSSPNGTSYSGEFKNGRRHGRGTITQPGSPEFTGYWLNGALVTSPKDTEPVNTLAEDIAIADAAPAHTPPLEVTSNFTASTSNNNSLTIPAKPTSSSNKIADSRSSQIIVQKIQKEKPETKVVATPSQKTIVIFVKGNLVNLRSEPDGDSEVLARYAQDKPLQWLKREGKWINVQDNKGRNGWIAKALSSATPPTDYLLVAKNDARLHAAPETDSATLQTLPKGMPIFPLTRQGDWQQIKLWDDQQGWIQSNLLTKSP